MGAEGRNAGPTTSSNCCSGQSGISPSGPRGERPRQPTKRIEEEGSDGCTRVLSVRTEVDGGCLKILKAIIDFVTPNNETEYRYLGRIERLYMEVIAAGDRLLAAQRAEGAYRPLGENSNGDGLEEWKSYRKTVDTLAEEYLVAIKTWRGVLEEGLNGSGPLSAPQGNWWRS